MSVKNIIAVALTMLCLLSFCNFAQAVVLDPKSETFDPQIVGWLDKAQAYWGQSVAPHCPQGILLTIDGQTPDAPNSLAKAYLGGCRILLMDNWYPEIKRFPTYNIWDDVYWREALCNGMVHEYGHLLGKPHSNNRNDVMYVGGKTPENSVPACEQKESADLTQRFEIVPKGRFFKLIVHVSNPDTISSGDFKVCVKTKKRFVKTKRIKEYDPHKICIKNGNLTPGSFKDFGIVFKKNFKKTPKISLERDF